VDAGVVADGHLQDHVVGVLGRGAGEDEAGKRALVRLDLHAVPDPNVVALEHPQRRLSIALVLALVRHTDGTVVKKALGRQAIL